MIQESHFPAPNDCEQKGSCTVIARFAVNKHRNNRDEGIIPCARIRWLKHKQKQD